MGDFVEGRADYGDQTSAKRRAKKKPAPVVAKRRAEKKPNPVVEKTSLPSSDLVAILHELRTPLNAIVGLADLMQQETFGPLGSPKYNDFSRDIKQSGEYLLGVISGVLNMSRLESDRFQMEINAAVRAAVTEQKLFAAEVEQHASRSPHMPSPVEARGAAALWDEAVASLGRSADAWSWPGRPVKRSRAFPREATELIV